MHDEAKKRLVEHLRSAVSCMTVKQGSIDIKDMERWRTINENIVIFLRKQGIPITSWQIDRIMKNIANECLIKARHDSVTEYFKNKKPEDINENDIKTYALSVSLPNEMVLDNIVGLFDNQPYRYNIYIPLEKLNIIKEEVIISNNVIITSSDVLTADLAAYIKEREKVVVYDYEEPDTTVIKMTGDKAHAYGYVQKKQMKYVKRDINIEDVLSYSFIQINLDGLIFIPIKYEPELSILRSRLRQFLSTLDLMGFINHLNYYERDAKSDTASGNIYINNTGKGLNKFDILNIKFDEMEIFKSLVLNKKLFKNSESPSKQIMKLLLDYDNLESSRLLSALDWYGYALIKSFNGADETFEYISYMMSIEALLGTEQPKASMTESLADKVGYLLGSDMKSRNDIREQFLALYEYRSKILHGRNTIYDLSGMEDIHLLKNITRDILKKEIDSYKNKL